MLGLCAARHIRDPKLVEKGLRVEGIYHGCTFTIHGWIVLKQLNYPGYTLLSFNATNFIYIRWSYSERSLKRSRSEVYLSVFLMIQQIVAEKGWLKNDELLIKMLKKKNLQIKKFYTLNFIKKSYLFHFFSNP